MADTALELRITAESNVPEVLAADERALQAQRRAREKAERDLTRLIDRGDPLKALERRQQRELETIRKMLDQQLITVERYEEARTQLAQRHAAERQQIEERAAQAAARVQAQAAQQQTQALSRIKGGINDVRGAVGALSGVTQSMFGQWAAGATSLLAAFASGGAISLAITGITAGITALTDRIREQREEVARLEAEARRAAQAADKALEDRIRRAEEAAQRRQDAALGTDRELVETQQLLGELTAEAGRVQADLTDAQARLVRAGSELAAAREAAQGVETERVRAAEQATASALGQVRRLTREYETLQSRIDRTASALHTLGQTARSSGTPRTPTGSGAVRETERFGVELMRAQEEAERVRELMEDGLRRSRDTIRRYAAEAQRDIAAYLRQADPFRALDIETRDQVETIEARIRELQAIARDPALRAEAVAAIADLEAQLTAVHERYRQQRDELEIRAIEQRYKLVRDNAGEAPKLDEQEAKQWEALGWQTGAHILSGIASYLRTNDPLELLRTLLMIGGGIANIFLPGAGSIIGAIGGFFDRGGPPFAFRGSYRGSYIPEGRRGLALGWGPSKDAKPAWLHPGEVVMPADVVARDFGGLPEAMAVAAGRGLPPRGPGMVVERIEIRAFDSADALRGLRTSLAPAQVERRSARQGALEASSLRAWGAAPRYA